MLQGVLGQTYRALGLAALAIPLQERRRDFHLSSVGPEHPDTIDAMHDLAASYAEAGRRDEALALGGEVLMISRKVKGADHPDTLVSMENLATFHSLAGREAEALAMRAEVLELSRKVHGPKAPQTVSAMVGLAVSSLEVLRLDEAAGAPGGSRAAQPPARG